MSVTREKILQILSEVQLPGGGDLVSRDMIRALELKGDALRFVIEAPDASLAQALPALEAEAKRRVAALAGIATVSVVSTAPAPASRQAPPQLKIGGHPKGDASAGPQPIAGIRRIIAIGSGKGGVGKSTLSANLAVALARQGRRVGLLDADIHGPSQPQMMGVSAKPASPDGQTIEPLKAHGVTLMSLGLMMNDGEAVIWRGPMLMGALQQMLGQVNWGDLDVLLIDLPPGTGDVQLSLCQRTRITGAIIVSTPQDVALLDARRAIDMFGKLKAPVLGLVENMSSYVCPSCGHEAHLFGHGGVADEAARLDLPFLGEIPLSLDVRVAGDSGTPIAAGDGPLAEAYAQLATRLVRGDMA